MALSKALITAAASTAAAVGLLGSLTALPAQVATALVNGATSGLVTSPGSGSPNKLLKIVQ